MLRYITIIAALLLVIYSCEENTPEVNIDMPVVEAFLYTNQTLDSIRIVKILPYNASGDTNIVINDPDVVITSGLETFTFKQSESNPEYFVNTGDSLYVTGGNTYEISFIYNNKQVYASTTALSIPVNLAISDTAITIDDESDMPFWDAESEFEISWDNDNDEYFMVSVQLTDTTSLEQINDNIDDPSTSMFMSPVNSSSINMNPRMIQYYGNYRVILIKVNTEYVELFESYNQNISSLVESPSNIENGKGIFTAMSTDTVYFDVVRD
ncbi:MAG: hypothetical protein A2X13_04935 [Bacteroidetes bacterium GWC2_33_15]|nr:MAG: hypothetical protein A2X10_12805 [Bacteroidetes bacterium GWA2_33_15]OFX50938.1 MAG: hypothetical protein A2X13_04935 [Bacteroidetes bacterium GWC2_33_15]OFX66557.1 MAG: hypothetical protein A2X15_15425 [Bacteroidetes bacterium GWB2_32_14]OFX70164.1 MAG: hypothetical protein A2X14_12695 [Bacteroidetes bacterium GWD2_33_33]HAN20024.1 hypothetical protein [Bacteroidales bacterium]